MLLLMINLIAEHLWLANVLIAGFSYCTIPFRVCNIENCSLVRIPQSGDFIEGVTTSQMVSSDRVFEECDETISSNSNANGNAWSAHLLIRVLS